MSRFKHLWLSFWRKDQGLGMIEAAITLPLFLVITFGVIEFGNMFMARYQARDIPVAVADYLKSKPSATSKDLQDFVTNLGFGILKNMQSGGKNNVYDKIRIKSEKTMKTATEFDDFCSGTAVKEWTNPFLSDGDASNDKEPYYIHICYPYTYDTITPLPDLTGGAIAETKTMNSKTVAYISNSISCPPGQILTGISHGKPDCGVYMPPYLCPEGEYLRGYYNGSPVCEKQRGNFGGMYTKANVFWMMDASCTTKNPLTNACSCPDFAPMDVVVGYVPMPVPGSSYGLHYCYR